MDGFEIINLIVAITSAVGTLGATIIALCLALQGYRHRIDCAFMWESATEDKPMLILNNISNHTVIVEYVDLYFHKEKIGRFDILRRSAYCKNAIISPNKEVRIVIKPNEVKLNIKGEPVKNPDTVYKLTAVVTTTTKKKYKSSYKYSYNELLGFTYVEENAGVLL